jgi:phosphoglycerate kinase
MFDRKTVTDVDVRGKRVLVRVDFNVPLTEGGAVADDTRVRAALPTIRHLLDEHCRIILMSHLGRPKGEPDPKFSLAPAARTLSKLLGRNVWMLDRVIGPDVTAAVDRMVPGEIIMLENLRFEPGEKANDPEFARELAALADVYVDDAFGASHRAHASTCGVAQFLPAVAGMLLEREVTTLRGLLESPARPFVAILGGNKVSDKIGVIDKFMDSCDSILTGGGMCFTFMKAQGMQIGKSLCESDWVDRAAEMLAKAEKNGMRFVLPTDFVVAPEIAEDAQAHVCGKNEIPASEMGLDIGPTTIELYKDTIKKAKTVFWNGPMGVFEMAPFANGTREVAAAMATSKAETIAGGGDTDAALRRFGREDQISFVSTGGGASLLVLEGKPLPGVECLEKKGS